MKQSRGARTIVYPTPVFIVGTYDAEGKPNIMAAAWGGIASSRPPAVSVALRTATLTHGNIVARQAFTISIPSQDHVEAADYVGIVSGREVDKFERTGLTPVRSDLVDAPYVAEFPMVLECRLLHILELGLHTLFVGEVLDVKADERVLSADGKIAIEKVRPLIFAPDGGGYYGVGDFVGQAFEIGRRIKDED